MLNSGLFAIFFSGAAGGALVLHAARASQGETGPGFALVLLIGLGLVGGLLELVWRDRRAVSQIQAITRLPAALPDRESVEGLRRSLPPRLRTEVEAYLAGRRGAPEAPTLTGHLVGLLVMLGLLGTFLGFVDTLAGARMVLERSSDIESIRNGLAAPLSGLTRSFGTSLAGVAASAALGLAAAVVRRIEARSRGALATWANVTLAPHAPAARELAALEQLSRQGDALPQAASAMTLAVSRLESLADRLVEAQREGAQWVATELTAAVRVTSTELGQAATAVAKAVSGAVEGAASSAGEHLTRAAEARFETWSTWLESQAAAQDTRFAQRFGALTDALERGLAQSTEAETRRTAALGDRLDETMTRVDRALATTTAGESARMESLGRQLTAVAETVASSIGRAAAAEVERAAQLSRSFSQGVAAQTEAMQKQAADHSVAVQARLAAVVESVTPRMTALVDAVESGLRGLDATATASAAALAETGERFGERVSRAQRDLAEGASALKAALVTLGEGTAGLETSVSARMTAHVAELDAALAREADRFIAAQGARADEAATVLQRVDAELARHLTELGQGLAGPLAEVARKAEAAPLAAANLVEAAAARWHEAGLRDAAREAALEALFHRLDTLATRLDAAVEVQTRLWGEAMEHTRDAAEVAEARAEARLATLGQSIAISIDRQAERLAEFELHFAQAREAGGSALAATLAEHARHLGEGLDATGALVREAADLVRSGGAELSAVAEMFADAVDRYRESSDAWRQVLGGLEDALSRGGASSGEAGQLMGSYLDQTREIFGDTMRFQRELFSELRALRGAST